MGLGIGLFLTAIGAILIWAVHATVSGVSIHAVGWILFIVGLVGVFLSLIFWSTWFGPGAYTGGPRRRRTTTVDEGPYDGPPY